MKINNQEVRVTGSQVTLCYRTGLTLAPDARVGRALAEVLGRIRCHELDQVALPPLIV